MPDRRSPLSCALLAAPRHALVAALRGQPHALRSLAQDAAGGSLAAISAAHAAKNSCPEAQVSAYWGDAARSGVEEWRQAVAKVLLEAGGYRLAESADHAGRTALHYAAGVGDAPAVKSIL